MEKIIAAILIFTLTIVIVGLFAALPTMWLWNWLMPEIFNLTEITFGQALGLVVLSSILFKSSNTKIK
jgi:biopolymer transport protein ExbB/TolQ